LNQRERERLKVLYEVKQKHLTQVEAAQRLKVTDRQVRRLLLALAERGDGAMVHGLRGRASNRKLQTSFEQRILTRVRQRYADSGPTLAAEQESASSNSGRFEIRRLVIRAKTKCKAPRRADRITRKQSCKVNYVKDVREILTIRLYANVEFLRFVKVRSCRRAYEERRIDTASREVDSV